MPTITDTGLVDYEAYLTRSNDYKGKRFGKGETGSDLFVTITKEEAVVVVKDPIAKKTAKIIDRILLTKNHYYLNAFFYFSIGKLYDWV